MLHFLRYPLEMSILIHIVRFRRLYIAPLILML